MELVFAKGATLQGLKYPMRAALVSVGEVWALHGQTKVTITAGTNGVHSVRSYHYTGYAVDFRTHQFSDQKMAEIKIALKKRLGFYYDVVVHQASHLHVEFDVERFRKHQESLNNPVLVTSL